MKYASAKQLVFAAVLIAGISSSTVAISAPPATPKQDANAKPNAAVDSPIAERPWQNNDGTISWRNQTFATWEEFRAKVDPIHWRCGAAFPNNPDEVQGEGGIAASTADCANNLTNPLAEYDPSAGDICITVVVHVIRNTAGTLGNLTTARINSQIARLNSDYAGAAIAGAVNTRIKFKLATVDPAGLPTTGITYHNNDTWYNDAGSYWTSIAWNPTKYLNIYTNTAAGNLGYVPALPSSGTIVGTTADRVVVYWEAFGDNPAFPPYQFGRSATHEVGHYLGLYHTFQGGCGTASCYTTGDRICDTNNEQSAHFGCAAQATCTDGADPIDNFMDYSDDPCMLRFTAEQAKRMRCTLKTWRVLLPNPCAVLGDVTGDGLVNGNDLATVLGGWGLSGVSDVNGNGITNGDDLAIVLSAWTG
jgi:hypothetical protein